MYKKFADPPAMPFRPEAEEQFERQKKVIFASVLTDLHKEARQITLAVEGHVKRTLGMKKPTFDEEASTETWESVKARVIQQYQQEVNLKEAKQREEEHEKEIEDLKKQISKLEMQAAFKSKILKEQQAMLGQTDIKKQLDMIKAIIDQFFRANLTTKEIPLIVDLQGQIEDNIMNPDEQR
jgi:hypothetical protein